MSRNGSGTMSLLATFATAGQAPSATSHNAILEDIASEITDSINVDGTKAFAAAQSMGGFKLTSVGTGTARTDAAPLGQVQDGKANWVAAGGTADAITATYSPAITALVDGQECCVRAGFANATTTPTFAPNGLTARTIVKNGGSALVAGDIAGANHEIILRYKLANTRWELLNPAPTVASVASVTEQLTGTDAAKSSTPDSVAGLWEAGADITDGATVTIGAGGYFNLITSTTAITAFTVTTDKAGRTFRCRFDTARTLTHNGTSLILPGAANITTAQGDIAQFRSLGSGNVVCEWYTRANGNPINISGSAPTYGCRAWVVFDGTGTPAITASGNVTSITDNGVGDYTITMTTALPDANYAVTGSAYHATRNAVVTVDSTTTPTTTVFRIRVGAIDLNAATAQADAYDSTRVSVAVFR